ncbi:MULTISPECIES: DciA family protein [Collinsella]|uniref:DciA family protein n=1 Tax=Collinsella TaxID=102106 RepID=UPI001F13884C|nr:MULTISPECIES: DciA family protein [Collinsella]MDM8162976.1 DciA family protein [Collinsella intestinalis]
MELNAYLDDERRRILGAASAERREQMTRAEQSRTVYRAWNAVCGGTREGAHVTGLRYLPDSNELLVYLDAPSWTQEMSMLREIIRARMEREGVSLAGFKFRTTKPGHVKSHVSRQPSSGSQANGAARSQAAAPGAARPAAASPARAPLSAEEDAALDAAVSPISDQKLAAALKKAMKASLEWKKANQ